MALLVALAPAGCATGAGQAEEVAAAEYAVLAEVVRHTVLAEGWGGPTWFYDEQRPIEYVVILGEPDPEGGPLESSYTLRELPALDSATAADFASKPMDVRFERRFEGIGEYRLVPADSLEAVFEQGWRSYYDRFPGAPGIVAFSRVGFNADTTQALVYAMRLRGGTSGVGSLLLLERQGQRWTVIDESKIWDA